MQTGFEWRQTFGYITGEEFHQAKNIQLLKHDQAPWSTQMTTYHLQMNTPKFSPVE